MRQTVLSMVKGHLTRPEKHPPRGGAGKVWTKIYLRKWRKLRKLSVEDLAEKAGLSPGLISQIENQLSAGSPDSLEKLAAALDCEVGELLDIEPEPSGAMVRMWVSHDDRERVKTMVQALSPARSA